MSRLLYILILLPLSRLSFPWIYRASDVLSFLLHRVLRYRLSVVRDNMQRCFPEWSVAERRRSESAFYLHLADLFMESVKQFSILDTEVLNHCFVVNPELLDNLSRKHDRVIVAAGHYGNWELAAIALGIELQATVQGIYSPLKDGFMDRKLKTSRERYGMQMLSRYRIKDHISRPPDRPEVLLFATDQTPSNARKSYWMSFFNQEAPVFFGAEKFAVENGWPVVFAYISKPRRGHYELKFELLTEDPGATAYGEITQMHTRKLEAEIRSRPEFWLWTHKRFKRTRPSDVPFYGPDLKEVEALGS